MSADLLDHYRLRAPQYEAIYFRPDEKRIVELERLACDVRGWMRGRQVLEVACGTGWWTVHAASTANKVTGIDANDAMLALARLKPLDMVEFHIGDAYRLDQIPGSFDAALACFWMSHVPKARLSEFLDGLVKRLEPRSRVLLADNVFDPDYGGPLLRGDESDDTYRMRPDGLGGETKVLKNYFTCEELGEMLRAMHNVTVNYGERYWWVRFETPEAP